MTYFLTNRQQLYQSVRLKRLKMSGIYGGIGLQINQAENAIYSIVTFYSLQALF